MESYQKLFAGDLNAGRTTMKNDGIWTLSERTITQCLFCGALTEVSPTNKPVAHLALYDPTGRLVVGYRTTNVGISTVLKETTLPAFVLCAAGIQCTGGECMPMLETLVPVSRAIRDTFVLSAADDLITRLEQSDIDPDKKKQLCTMADTAIATVLIETPVPAASAPVVDEAVTKAVLVEIQTLGDERSTVSVDTLISALKTKGIAGDTTRAALKSLIEEGDCYQPKPDVIRIL